MIPYLIMNTQPLESNSEKDNEKVLTTLNYIIVLKLNESSYHIETGDNYIFISSENDVDDLFINTIHLVDEDDMNKFNNVIENIFH